ncbi:hypothetical protein Bbelb_261640 [Branchiostoma belcheri]|nr:hypothetical protein Bbelb_261640 [Branchiostoma belcheri]
MAAQQPRFPAVQDVERQQQTPPPPQHVEQQRAPGLQQQGPQQQGLQQQAPLPQGQLPVGGAHVAPQQAQLPTAQLSVFGLLTSASTRWQTVERRANMASGKTIAVVPNVSAYANAVCDGDERCPSPEEVSAGRLKASADSLLFRDPDTFRAGEIHRHKESWQAIIGEDQKSLMVKNWIENGVSLFDFIQPFTDDRHAAQLASRNQVQRVETMEVEESSEPDYEAAQAACFILCSVLIGLGFFIGIDKSQLDPKLAGKLVSFGLAVPAARLYCREIFEAVKQAQRKGALVPIQGNLKEQLEHWRFLDTWEGHVPWRAEKREVVTLSSDASGFRWGGSWTTEEHSVQCGDYWQQRERQNIIAVKETEALRRVLLSAEALVRNKKVDARVDNMNLIAAWHNQGGRSIDLSRAIVKLWETVMEYNVDLNLIFVPSKENEADAPSRRVSGSDVKLHEELFQRIDEELGGPSGFDTDLMALPSNVQTGRDGKKLKFFSRDPAPGSCGVNVFAQNLTVHDDTQKSCNTLEAINPTPSSHAPITSQNRGETLAMSFFGHGTARVWVPVVRGTSCGSSNDCGFNFVRSVESRDGSSIGELKQQAKSMSKEGHALAAQPSSAATSNALRRYLQKLGIDERETLHCRRSGCDISLHMARASSREVMDCDGLVTRKTASHYMKIAQVLEPGGPASRLTSEEVRRAVATYKQNNAYKD